MRSIVPRAVLIAAAVLLSGCGDSAPAAQEQPQQPNPAAGRQVAQIAQAGQAGGDERPEADSAVLEGEVWFAAGAVELPDGAIATVSLLDASLQDVAATLIGEQVQAVAALPFDFRIEYDPSLIQERNDYSLQARVELDGELLYVNDTVHPVLTRGSPAESGIEVVRIESPDAGGESATITVRVVPAEGSEIPLGGELTARLVNAHRPSEVIDERSIPILAFPVELNLRYDLRGLDPTYTYEIDVFIADGGRVLFGVPLPIRFDPSGPPAEPLLVALEMFGSDGWPSGD